MSKAIFRQGDVLFVMIEEVPGAAHRVEGDDRRRYVLAEGEATGHAHALAVLDGVEVHSLAEALFIRAEVPVAVTHEEHDTITLPPGVWRVARQVEYTPAELRRVAD